MLRRTIYCNLYDNFSMNTQVTATGMNVKAKAEGGIVIAAYTKTASSTTYSNDVNPGVKTDASFTPPADTAFKSEASINNTASELYPTSTLSGLSAWYHASSDAVDNYAAKAGTYEVLGTVYSLATDGIAYDKTTFAEQGQYFLLNKFQVKATDAGTYSLYLTGITVTKTSPSGTSGSAELNKALRIAIKVGGNTYFFAPNWSSGTPSYYNGTSRTAWAVAAEAGKIALGSEPNATISTNITSAPTDVEVYIYYEGEDEACKSINAINIDALKVDLTFSSTAP